MKMYLRRVAENGKAVFGVLVTEGGTAFALTLERPYEGGSNRASTEGAAGACIPAGRYVCRRVTSPKFGVTFEVTDVPGRSHILFHAGNLASDSRGCILVGERFDPLGGEDGVLASREGLAEFFRRTASERAFVLEIEDRFL